MADELAEAEATPESDAISAAVRELLAAIDNEPGATWALGDAPERLRDATGLIGSYEAELARLRRVEAAARAFVEDWDYGGFQLGPTATRHAHAIFAALRPDPGADTTEETGDD